MATALELSSTTIRLIRTEVGRIKTIEEFPIPADADPIAALSSAPLPRPLGDVRVSLSHADLLVKSMVQPPVPPERLERVIHFELASLGENLMVSHHIPSVGGASGDLRILCLVSKPAFTDRIAAALAEHGGKLKGLTHPAVGLYHAYINQNPDDTSTAVLVDIGGAHLHTALVENGELVFIRTTSPGIGEFTKDIAELRGIGHDDAAKLIAKLGRNTPDDIKEIIGRHAARIATSITNNIRFAQTQLKLDAFEAHAIHLGGAGARIPGLSAALKERLKTPVRLINPWAARVSTMHPDDLDALSQLPSPLTVALGTSAAERLALDVMDYARAERKAYWRTSGVLRAAVAACVAFVLIAAAVQHLNLSAANAAIAQLGTGDENGPGLVPQAEAVYADINAQRAEQDQAAKAFDFLEHERRPGRVAIEFLNTVAALQDPDRMPVFIRGYRVNSPSPGVVRVELEGFAQDAGTVKKGDVVNQFRAALRQRYPRITEITELEVGAFAQRLPLHWIIEIDGAG